MSADLFINMSNEQVPIYRNSEWTDPGPQIGKLYPREAFSAEDGEGFVNIYFRNSSGVLTLGYIVSDVSKDVFTLGIKYPYEKKTFSVRSIASSSLDAARRYTLQAELAGEQLLPV